MSGSKAAFARAIDSQFERLGQDAIYVDTTGQHYPIRVIARLPEQLFDVGEQQLHAEKAQLLLRVTEVPAPHVGDSIIFNGNHCFISREPQLENHQLIWVIESVTKE